MCAKPDPEFNPYPGMVGPLGAPDGSDLLWPLDRNVKNDVPWWEVIAEN